MAMDDLVVGDTAKQVREAFLNEFASSGQLLLDFHGSFPGLGYVTRARKSRRKEQGRGVGTGMIDGIDVEYGRYEYKWEDVDVSRIDVLDSTQFHEQCLA